ncbi:MFS transporter [Streptomyces anulatus]
MTVQDQRVSPAGPRGMPRGLTLLFAIAAGASVGNMYWAQPLLVPIAGDLGVASGDAGFVITLTQIGYAVGVFLMVPLGDAVDRRRVVPLIMLGAAVALAASAAAPSFLVLLGVIALVGATSVAGQILTPMAGDLATDAQRGRVLGTVASGLMLGILLSRTLSGLVADVLGWRMVFVAGSALMLVLAVVLSRRLPRLETRRSMPYGQLLLSVLRTVKGDRRVQVTILLGALPMSVFTLFWTGLTLADQRVGGVHLGAEGGAVVGAQHLGRGAPGQGGAVDRRGGAAAGPRLIGVQGRGRGGGGGEREAMGGELGGDVGDPLGELVEEGEHERPWSGSGSVARHRGRRGGGGCGLQGGLVFSKAWMRWPIVLGVAASPTQRPVVVKTGTSSRSASNMRT